MRPPPLWLPSLLFCGLGATMSLPDSFSQLAAPLNPKLHLYNEEQILTWEPSPSSNDARPVVYQVEYSYIDGTWYRLQRLNCTDIAETKCDFTGGGRLKGFTRSLSVFLRVRAKQGNRTSDWVTLDPFLHYENVTVGPPKNISVTPGKDSLVLHFSPPFNVDQGATFQYLVHYWEKTGTQQVEGPFKSNSIVLGNLKPFRVYCLQTEAQLILKNKNIRPHGLLSNVSCHETTADASTRLPPVILIPVGIFTLLLVLTGACFILFLRYQSRLKYWFQAPPNIPEQIKEYLKDPDQFILEALDKDSSPKDDSWDSVSIISSPEKD
ncbi:interferon gamma receptor 2 isoform X2 [Grammomys surdaster]|uniref:interferon gamma receptor 2 isoform X2 n=1 Tax=Grammomys surdaster TaxID=491861 RepID=UPI00109F32E4|nr:interferon gamma receptor 2 isoform X2 [Grammomys surdaster]